MFNRAQIMKRAWEIYEARRHTRKLVSTNAYGKRFDQRQRGWDFSLALQAAWNEAKVAGQSEQERAADRAASIRNEIGLLDYASLRTNRAARLAELKAELTSLLEAA